VKGVVLAGGTGSRLDPLTRITNKHLLPIYDRPMIEYSIEALVGAGIDEIMIVTGGTHAGEFLRLFGNGHEHGIDTLVFGYQERPGGIAEALGLAEHFVDRGQCVVMLADNVFERSLAEVVERFRHQQYGARFVLAAEDDADHLRHLGVPELDGDAASSGSSRSPPSRRASMPSPASTSTTVPCGDVLPSLEPSGRGELEITDVNNWYVERGAADYDIVEGFWGDADESIDAYYAVNDFVRGSGANK
jgi:glucose-1-phosphate thymidylyltransferase